MAARGGGGNRCVLEEFGTGEEITYGELGEKIKRHIRRHTSNACHLTALNVSVSVNMTKASVFCKTYRAVK